MKTISRVKRISPKVRAKVSPDMMLFAQSDEMKREVNTLTHATC
jgi:hypothetical protein